MGADCCGGSKATTGEAAAKTDFGEATARLPRHEEGKSWDDIVEEKKRYYAHRVEMFEAIKARHDAALQAAKDANVSLSVTMPDGSIKEAVKGVTTPLDIANSISKGLAKKSIVAKVDGSAWDLCRPLEDSCSLQLLTFQEPEGKDVRRTKINVSSRYFSHIFFIQSHSNHILDADILALQCSFVGAGA